MNHSNIGVSMIRVLHTFIYDYFVQKKVLASKVYFI